MVTNRVRSRLVGLLVVGMSAMAGSSAAGQSHTEVMVGTGLSWGSRGDLGTSFLSVLENSVATGGSGGQRLTLDPQNAPAFVAAVRHFFSPSWGVEARVTRASQDLGGENTPYGVELTYVAMIPGPSGFTPTPTRYAASTAWPDTEGELDRLVVSASMLGRLRRGRVSLTGGGGVAWQRASGEAQPIGYTAFLLGGRSVLFVSDYQLSTDLATRWKTGVQGSGEVSFDLNAHVAVAGGVQVAAGPDLSLPASVRDIVESTPVPSATLGDIRSNISVGPARVPFVLGTIYVGVTLR